MKVLRTPDACFEGLEDYAFKPHYTEIQDEDGTVLRIHHVEEGPVDGPKVLLMHGNPTWAYLYRKMIPPLVAAGCRVLVVDLVGLGRSDKPADRADYTLARHYDWIAKWFEARELKDLTLFCQDWGGTIGLAMVARMPERFDRVVACNTGVPAGEGGNDTIRMWLGMMAQADEFPFDMVMQGAMTRVLTPEIMAAYKAPFPETAYHAGAVAFPQLIAIFPDNPGVALNQTVWDGLRRFDKPFLTVWADSDPVSAGGDRKLHKEIPGCQGQPHVVLPNTGHFLQEDAPEAAAGNILRFMGL